MSKYSLGISIVGTEKEINENIYALYGKGIAYCRREGGRLGAIDCGLSTRIIMRVDKDIRGKGMAGYEPKGIRDGILCG